MKLRNVGDAVDLYRPAGVAGSRYVESGGEVDVLGKLADRQLVDAIVIVLADEETAWPIAQWELVSDEDHEQWRIRRPIGAAPVPIRAAEKPLTKSERRRPAAAAEES